MLATMHDVLPQEMFDLLEQATDRCEDCANVLESVVVKHG